MKHPVEFIADVAVQLCAHKPVFGRKHVVVFRIAGSGGVEKTKIMLCIHLLVYFYF
jgi:hypothetical protein